MKIHFQTLDKLNLDGLHFGYDLQLRTLPRNLDIQMFNSYHHQAGQAAQVHIRYKTFTFY
jgi:hypothetical protein